MARVPLKVIINSKIVVPKFAECLLDVISGSYCDRERIFVNFSLEKDGLIVRRAEKNGAEQGSFCFLRHSHACPMQALAESNEQLPESISTRDVVVAVSVIVESSDHHVLLTRRPRHMRSSPGVWVPPGGHLEPGESLLNCGLREVYEETGLNLREEITSLKTLCLWENVFPISITLGTPKYHSLVIYYHIHCRSNHQELIKRMRIDPSEVMAYTWLSPLIVAEIFSSNDEEKYVQKQYVWNKDSVEETELKYLSMFYRFIWTSSDVYSGVQCSLFEWLKDYRSRQLVINKL